MLTDPLYISAVTGEGVEALLAAITERLPESPFLYPDDELSTHPVRYFVAEMIRETALDALDEEVPYAIACEVDEYARPSARYTFAPRSTSNAKASGES